VVRVLQLRSSAAPELLLDGGSAQRHDHAQAPLRSEELLVADIDVDEATRAMFLDDMKRTADLLFSDTVVPSEYSSAL